MVFLIREAVISDAEAICGLNRTEMGYSYPKDDTRTNLEKILARPSDKVFVAVSDDTVVGYIHANDYDLIYAPHMKNIMGIAVSEPYKCHGIGRALLQAVEQWALETGASAVRLVSGAARTQAHAFYRRCGYSGDKNQLNLKKEF